MDMRLGLRTTNEHLEPDAREIRKSIHQTDQTNESVILFVALFPTSFVSWPSSWSLWLALPF